MTQKDFDKMEHNPFGLGKSKMWEVYPFFTKRNDFCTPLDGESEATLNELLRFIVATIDEQSPFFKETDLDYKQKECMRLLGIKEGSDAYNMIKDESDWYQSLVTQYFAFLDFDGFEYWHTLKTRLSQALAYLRNPTNMAGDVEKQEKIKDELASKIPQRRKDIQKLENELFPNKRLQQKIIKYSNNEKLTGFAEMFAQPAPYLQKVVTS
jgi:hypothetical protein